MREWIRKVIRVLSQLTKINLVYKLNEDIDSLKEQLKDSKVRIESYILLLDDKRGMITNLKTRSVILEGFIKALVSREQRFYLYIENTELLQVHNHFPSMEVKDFGKQTRIRLKENKEWRTPDASEPKNGSVGRSLTPEPS